MSRDHPGVDAQARLAAMRDVVEELLGTLPTCDACKAPATKAHSHGSARYCDEHGQDSTPDLPCAWPLRRLYALWFGKPR